MSIFNIDALELASTFEGWYIKTNEIIDAVNSVTLVDVEGDGDLGITVTANAGGVIALGVKAGAGLGFDNDGNLTIGGTNANFTTVVKTRTASTDQIIVIEPTTKTAKYVSANSMIPSTFGSDTTFSGDITFTGDVTFASSAFSVQTLNSAFTDNLLELSVLFDDELTFASVGALQVGDPVYLVDRSVVGFDLSGLNTSASATYIGTGTVSDVTTGSGGTVQVNSFTFTSSGDSWANYTDAGATVGGDIALVEAVGGISAAGLRDQTEVKAATADQTSPLNADDSGFAVVTSDGDKKFSWQYNGSTAASAFTSFDNLAVDPDKTFYVNSIQGGEPDSTTDVITFWGSSGGVVKAETRFQERGDSDYFFTQLRESGSANSMNIGYVGAGTTIAFTLNQDGSMTANAAQLLNTNFNADLLDGAQGSTVAAANVVPIARADGTIDPAFVYGDGAALRETITQTSHNLVAGNVVRQNTSGNFVKAQADSTESAEVLGIVESVINSNSFVIVYFGVIGASGFGGVYSGMTSGSAYFLDPDTAGAITTAVPDDVNEVVKPVLIAMNGGYAYVTNFKGEEVYPATDSLYARSILPVGSVYYSATDDDDALGILRGDFVRCDGSIYSGTTYPDLADVIAGKHYADVTWISTGGGRIILLGANTRNFASGQTIRLTYTTSTGASFSDILTITSVTPGSGQVAIAYSGSLSGTPATNVTHKLYGSGDYFLVPDLIGRSAVGAGTDPDGSGSNSGNISAVALGAKGNYGASSAVSSSQIQSGPYIGLTPVIRARQQTAAIIIDGHRHDDRYLSFLDDQTATFTEAQRQRAITNLTHTDGLLVTTYLDQTAHIDVAGKRQAQRNIGIKISPENESPTGSGEIDLDEILERAGLTLEQANQYFVRYDVRLGVSGNPEGLTIEEKNNLRLNGGLLSTEGGTLIGTQTINGALLMIGDVEIGNGADLVIDNSGTFTVRNTPTGTSKFVVDVDSADGVLKIDPLTQVANPVGIHLGSPTGNVNPDGTGNYSNNQLLYIRGVRSPLISSDAANKSYVDIQIANLNAEFQSTFLRLSTSQPQSVTGPVVFQNTLVAQHSSSNIVVNNKNSNIWSKFTNPQNSDNNSNLVVRARDTWYHEKMFQDTEKGALISSRANNAINTTLFNPGQVYQHAYQSGGSGDNFNKSLWCQGFLDNGVSGDPVNNPFRLAVMETPFVPHRARVRFGAKLQRLEYAGYDSTLVDSVGTYTDIGLYNFDLTIDRVPSGMPTNGQPQRTIYSPSLDANGTDPEDPFKTQARGSFIGAVSHSGHYWNHDSTSNIVSSGLTINPVIGLHSPYGSGNTTNNRKILCNYFQANDAADDSPLGNPFHMPDRSSDDQGYDRYEYWDWRSERILIGGRSVYFFAKFWTGREQTYYHQARNLNGSVILGNPVGFSFWGLVFDSGEDPYNNTVDTEIRVGLTNVPRGIISFQSMTTDTNRAYMTVNLEGHATGDHRYLGNVPAGVPDLNVIA